MAKRDTKARLIIKGEASERGEAIHTSADLSKVVYTNGHAEQESVAGIKKLLISLQQGVVRCIVNQVLAINKLRRVATVHAASAEINSMNCRRRLHDLALTMDKSGNVQLLLDGRPLEAEGLKIYMDTCDTVRVDITGLYLDKIDVDIDGMEEVQ